MFYFDKLVERKLGYKNNIIEKINCKYFIDENIILYLKKKFE